jgi:hypothetical protein
MPSRFMPALLIGLLIASRGFAQPPEPGVRPQTLPPADLPPPRMPTPDQAPGRPAPPPCACPLGVKTIPYGQVLLIPQERATTLPRWGLREVEVGRGPGGPVLSFHEERQVVTELQLQPCEVEQQVTCMESKPQTVTDPCTGQCRTTYVSCPVVKTVKVKVYQAVPVHREVVVRVPVLKPGPEVVLKKLELDMTTVPAVETTYRALTTPGAITVTAPACPAPAPPLCQEASPPGPACPLR